MDKFLTDRIMDSGLKRNQENERSIFSDKVKVDKKNSTQAINTHKSIGCGIFIHKINLAYKFSFFENLGPFAKQNSKSWGDRSSQYARTEILRFELQFHHLSKTIQ